MELITSGELIITSKELISDAVKEHVSGLYKEDEEFYKNRYRTQREYESLTPEDLEEISDNIIWYLTND